MREKKCLRTFFFGKQEDLEKRMMEVDDSVKLSKKMKVNDFRDREHKNVERNNSSNGSNDTKTPRKFSRKGPAPSETPEGKEVQGAGPSKIIEIVDCTGDADTVSTNSVRNTEYRLPLLVNNPENFKAGKIQENLEPWKSISNDRYLLGIVSQEIHLNFESEPCDNCSRKELKFKLHEELIIDDLL